MINILFFYLSKISGPLLLPPDDVPEKPIYILSKPCNIQQQNKVLKIYILSFESYIGKSQKSALGNL